MATNSIREQILEAVKATLVALSPTIKAVDRKPLTGISALKNVPATRLPLAIVLGKLPVPEIKESSRDRDAHLMQSKLGIDILVYGQDNTSPDTAISNLADTVWAALFANYTLGISAVLRMEIKPEANVAVWEPYYAFKMLVTITYIHDKGGI